MQVGCSQCDFRGRTVAVEQLTGLYTNNFKELKAPEAFL